jgi:glutamate/tyrosine decarboxylase-like PLP-dependent enzyme/hypothetical membrane protein
MAALGVLGFVVGFWVLDLLGARVNPGYSLTRDYVSSLAAVGARLPWIGIAAIVSAGLAHLCAATVVRQLFPDAEAAARVSVVALRVAGVATVVVALSPITCLGGAAGCHLAGSDPTRSWTDVLHGRALVLYEVALVVAAVAVALTARRHGRRALAAASAVLAVGSPVLALSIDSASPGVGERLWILAGHSWLVLLAFVRLRQVSPAVPARHLDARLTERWCGFATRSRLPAMTMQPRGSQPADDWQAVLARAGNIAQAYLQSLPERRVPATATADELLAAFRRPLGGEGQDPLATLEQLAAIAEPGLTATSSPRFFGFVIGGTIPVAIAADWLTAAWDQNAGLRFLTPAAAAAAEASAAAVLSLLGLPAAATVGLVTGGTMANFTGLAAGRHAVLQRAGWDVEARGLQGAPPVRVLAGAERHETVDIALRYLGLGHPHALPVDDQGRIRLDALEVALRDAAGGPTLVALQAGNVHSGACDDFAAAIPLAHRHSAWVHVDGAFGLWAAANPQTAPLVAGVEHADSWATDAHKTLNVPYDCGLAIVRDATAHRAALGVHAPYLIQSETRPDPLELGPEFSQRGRGFVLWATLRTLGRSGVADLVGRLCAAARQFADGVRAIGGEVLHDVVFTQVCVSFDDDATTRAVEQRLLADGTTWMTGSTWHGRRVLRFAASNWATTEQDVEQALGVLATAVADSRNAGAPGA